MRARVEKLEFKPDKKAIGAELKNGTEYSRRRPEIRRLASGDRLAKRSAT